jgi:hypothetical protein
MSSNVVIEAAPPDCSPHGWALKHWYFERTFSFEDYVTKQTTLALNALIQPRYRRRYRRLLDFNT